MKPTNVAQTNAVIEKARALRETPVWRTATGGWKSNEWSSVWMVAWFEGWSDDTDLVGKIADLLVSRPRSEES